MKEVARSLLTSGCEKLMAKIFGDEKAQEMKQLRSSGAAPQELREKVRQFANEIDDEGEKAEALQYGSTCQQILEVVVRRRRNAPLRTTVNHPNQQPQGEVESPLRARCREVLFNLLGKERVDYLKGQQANGAGEQWLRAKVHYYLEEMRWEGDVRLSQFTDQCRDAFGINAPGYGPKDEQMVVVQKKVGNTPWAYVVQMDDN